jgi:hypothetical protein
MQGKIFLFVTGLLLIGSSIFAQDMTIDSNGNVGIGTANPSQRLSVNGIIESTGGGIKFPDGTVQTTASSGGGGTGGGSYAKVAIVAQGGGDYTDPLSAMNEVALWCGTPSSTNPCLLKIMPGVYDIGAMTIQMNSYVDIEGSGENTTKITGNFGENWWTGVIDGADFSEIRFLTVENAGGGAYAVAIALENVSPKITNIKTISSGATENVGIICFSNCSPTLTNVTSVAAGGTLTIGVYIDDTSSPKISNVKAYASDGNRNIGFDMDTNSSPVMTNVTAVATGGSKNHAIHIQRASTPVIINARIIASDGTEENYGFWNVTAASPTLINVMADASGGMKNYGVYYNNVGYSGGTLRIDHSVIKGTTGAIHTDDSSNTYTTQIGSTRLLGSVTGDGTNKCAGVYDDNYTFYANSCP